MSGVQSHHRDLLRLTLVPGLGPARIARLLEQFGSCEAIFLASPAELARIKGLGDVLSRGIAAALRDSDRAVDEELALAEKHGVHLLAKGDAEYPSLLAELPDAPPMLYVRGMLRPRDEDRYPIAIVGSRACTAYGVEQAERFGGVLASSGLTIVSGGARGIDTAAHRGAMRSNGRTIAVLGCGLCADYPPENTSLFEQIAQRGAVVSELPMRTVPDSKNFPARNRLISGLSLGVIVIEAGERSGALITARIAVEDHGREVMAVPGRVDSPASRGTLDLLRQGGAHLVTCPGDVLTALESSARHVHVGTHADRFPAAVTATEGGDGSLFAGADAGLPTGKGVEPGAPSSPTTRMILDALAEPKSLDQLVRATGLSPSALLADLTMLEIQKRVTRDGPLLALRRP